MYINLDCRGLKVVVCIGCDVSDTWKNFCDKPEQASVSYEAYRQVFEEEKITFGDPPQDECDVCVAYNQHMKDEEHDDICPVGDNAKHHLERARAARHEYQQPAASDEHVFAADMQKVILLPKMTIKEHFFVSRLVVFNETFASITAKQLHLVVLWHEGITGRMAADVVSAYVRCLTYCASQKVVFWVDNCAAQNKNWTLFTTLVLCVNADWGPEQVNIKFLEGGGIHL